MVNRFLSKPFRDYNYDIYKLCCYYQAKTELYDRTLTDKRSRHDPTEAFIYSPLERSMSNKYAKALREKILSFAENEMNISRSEFLRIFNDTIKKYPYSALGWIETYKYLFDRGEMEFFEKGEKV